MKNNKKEKVWFLTKQNTGRKVETFDVWTEDPRKLRGWPSQCKVYLMKEIKKDPKDKKGFGQ